MKRWRREAEHTCPSPGGRAVVMHVLELITRLKQICNFCPETGSSAKADDLVKRLNAMRSYPVTAGRQPGIESAGCSI